MDVLRAFSADAPVLGNKEISVRTGLPKATVSRLTYTLTSLGFLHFLPDAGKYGRYVLGRAVISLSHPLLANMRLRQAARAPMRLLADCTGGAVSLGVRDRLNMVYVHTAKPCESAGWMSDLGKTFPIVRSTMGGAYIAALPAAARRALLDEVRMVTPALWEESRSHVAQSIEGVRRYGFCVNEGRLNPRVHVVAASIRVPERPDPYVFNVVIPAEASTAQRLRREVGPRLLEFIAAMEERLAQDEREPPQPLPRALLRQRP